MKTILATILSLFIFYISSAQNQCDNHCNANAGPDKSTCCSVSIGNPSTSCQNNMGDPNCASSSLSYSWSPTTGLSNSTICNPTASPTATTTYTLTVTFTCGFPGSGAPGCCCDGCSGTVCTSGDPNVCNGTQQRTDHVVVTYNGPNCCRIVLPEQLPEVSSDGVDVFPNPGSGLVNISFTKGKTDMAIHIYDSSGRCIYGLSECSDQKLEIDLSDKPKGMYYVQIKNAESVLCYKKLVLQ